MMHLSEKHRGFDRKMLEMLSSCPCEDDNIYGDKERCVGRSVYVRKKGQYLWGKIIKKNKAASTLKQSLHEIELENGESLDLEQNHIMTIQWYRKAYDYDKSPAFTERQHNLRKTRARTRASALTREENLMNHGNENWGESGTINAISEEHNVGVVLSNFDVFLIPISKFVSTFKSRKEARRYKKFIEFNLKSRGYTFHSTGMVVVDAAVCKRSRSERSPNQGATPDEQHHRKHSPTAQSQQDLNNPPRNRFCSIKETKNHKESIAMPVKALTSKPQNGGVRENTVKDDVSEKYQTFPNTTLSHEVANHVIAKYLDSLGHILRLSKNMLIHAKKAVKGRLRYVMRGKMMKQNAVKPLERPRDPSPAPSHSLIEFPSKVPSAAIRRMNNRIKTTLYPTAEALAPPTTMEATNTACTPEIAFCPQFDNCGGMQRKRDEFLSFSNDKMLPQKFLDKPSPATKRVASSRAGRRATDALLTAKRKENPREVKRLRQEQINRLSRERRRNHPYLFLPSKQANKTNTLTQNEVSEYLMTLNRRHCINRMKFLRIKSNSCLLYEGMPKKVLDGVIR